MDRTTLCCEGGRPWHSLAAHFYGLDMTHETARIFRMIFNGLGIVLAL
jgi:hypothetical protein